MDTRGGLRSPTSILARHRSPRRPSCPSRQCPRRSASFRPPSNRWEPPRRAPPRLPAAKISPPVAAEVGGVSRATRRDAQLGDNIGGSGVDVGSYLVLSYAFFVRLFHLLVFLLPCVRRPAHRAKRNRLGFRQVPRIITVRFAATLTLSLKRAASSAGRFLPPHPPSEGCTRSRETRE